MKDSRLPWEYACTSKNTIQASNKKYKNLQPPVVTSEHIGGNNTASMSSNIALQK